MTISVYCHIKPLQILIFMAINIQYNWLIWLILYITCVYKMNQLNKIKVHASTKMNQFNKIKVGKYIKSIVLKTQ